MLDLLSRLDGVRYSSDSHGMAKCPAHDDKSVSLSWRDAGDKWLLNCFRGCTALQISEALGIEFRQLFHDSQIKASYLHNGKQRANPRDVLRVLAEEATVVWIIAHDLLEEGPVDEQTMERLAEAVSRLENAKEACNVV